MVKIVSTTLIFCLVFSCLLQEVKMEPNDGDLETTDEQSLDDYLSELSSELDDLNPMYDVSPSNKKKLNQKVDEQLNEL